MEESGLGHDIDGREKLSILRLHEGCAQLEGDVDG